MSTTITSPKRKRVEDRPATPKIQVTCPIPRFQASVGDNGDPDVDGSPRTRVAGHFQRLDLDQQEDNFDLGLEERENKRLATEAAKTEVQHLSRVWTFLPTIVSTGLRSFPVQNSICFFAPRSSKLNAF